MPCHKRYSWNSLEIWAQCRQYVIVTWPLHFKDSLSGYQYTSENAILPKRLYLFIRRYRTITNYIVSSLVFSPVLLLLFALLKNLGDFDISIQVLTKQTYTKPWWSIDWMGQLNMTDQEVAQSYCVVQYLKLNGSAHITLSLD